MDLSGITAIDKEIAGELARYSGPFLGLNGLAAIDIEVATELGNCKATELELGGLTELDAGVCQALARIPGMIRLNGIESLTLQDEALLANRSGAVDLGGLKVLRSAKLAEKICEQPRNLFQLESLESAVAKVIAATIKHEQDNTI